MQPLAGRRLWLAGIGGAGMSGYAILARAWGADVSGWDRVETPYLDAVRAADIPVEISAEPTQVPPGAEAYVSTAFAGRVEGRPRSDLLAELTSLRDSIVVAGAHGKTTTAAMIAFCLDRLGRDPAFLIGADIPQLGGNARAGEGWLVVEGDESDRTVFTLPARVGVVTNVDLDHHTTFGSTAELAGEFERWAASLPKVVWGRDLEPVPVEIGVPGDHNRLNAACALAALEAVGVPRKEAAPLLEEFRGANRRLEPVGESAGVRVLDDYAHHPAEVEATLAAARELWGQGRILVLFQPHLYSRTLHLAVELGVALARADVTAVTDVYAAREEPVPGVTGKLLVDRISEVRPGMRVAWTPQLADGAAFVADQARSGDVVLTIGAGDVGSAGSLILERLSR